MKHTITLLLFSLLATMLAAQQATFDNLRARNVLRPPAYNSLNNASAAGSQPGNMVYIHSGADSGVWVRSWNNQGWVKMNAAGGGGEPSTPIHSATDLLQFSFEQLKPDSLMLSVINTYSQIVPVYGISDANTQTEKYSASPVGYLFFKIFIDSTDIEFNDYWKIKAYFTTDLMTATVWPFMDEFHAANGLFNYQPIIKAGYSSFALNNDYIAKFYYADTATTARSLYTDYTEVFELLPESVYNLAFPTTLTEPSNSGIDYIYLLEGDTSIAVKLSGVPVDPIDPLVIDNSPLFVDYVLCEQYISQDNASNVLFLVGRGDPGHLGASLVKIPNGLQVEIDTLFYADWATNCYAYATQEGIFINADSTFSTITYKVEYEKVLNSEPTLTRIGQTFMPSPSGSTYITPVGLSIPFDIDGIFNHTRPSLVLHPLVTEGIAYTYGGPWKRARHSFYPRFDFYAETILPLNNSVFAIGPDYLKFRLFKIGTVVKNIN